MGYVSLMAYVGEERILLISPTAHILHKKDNFDILQNILVGA